jgi:hypothetical protein
MDKQHETIFFATFETSKNMKCDRRAYFDSYRSLESFHFWIDSLRDDIEEDYKCKCTVTSINIIRS